MSKEIVIPSWITSEKFVKLLSKTITDFKGIKNFKVCPALAPGENYATVMLKVHIDCLLTTGTVEKFTLMLKVPHDNDLYRNEMIKWHMFPTEAEMYRRIVPGFEELYRSKGMNIRFGATAYELPTVTEEYILLEDLGRRGFRNVKRQDCLDMNHCKGVLRKLAQFHAASAVWVEKKGKFSDRHSRGIVHEEGKVLLGSMFTSGLQHLLKTTKNMKSCDKFYPELEKYADKFMEEVFKQTIRDDNTFNVLNHGDCWSNNIMFQYDVKGELKETYFVDLQLPSYGTPAQDLLYFILSSAKLDLKIQHFDEMIHYYHKHLIENLTFLGYTKSLPYLRDIHQMILKGSIWAMITVLITMAAVLCDTSDSATVDNFVSDSADSQQFKELLFSNERFKAHWEVVLPWLYYRGALEI
ncbi:uncharacterized protein LOC133335440 [Musca vetustissima]|uniref:uncharacterized protein LOC133335440 n=1 Tax=Musca vetustissima TaxID=27455 RepID=UPI002AB75299|nr:uncharacterized protein LOC133335440 [Musca vetustissima]